MFVSTYGVGQALLDRLQSRCLVADFFAELVCVQVDVVRCLSFADAFVRLAAEREVVALLPVRGHLLSLGGGGAQVAHHRRGVADVAELDGRLALVDELVAHRVEDLLAGLAGAVDLLSVCDVLLAGLGLGGLGGGGSGGKLRETTKQTDELQSVPS